MKIVTYNVNGLRPRIAQHGSLLRFLNSLEADIICIQETKLSRCDISADLFMAEGYEAFFSCTRTIEKGRVGYSGVVTFCRVKSAFSSNEVALPLAAEEGFTGLLNRSKSGDTKSRDFLIKMLVEVDDLEQITKDDLCKVDCEGRCIITDHGHFVLFNLYGPRAQCNDMERIQFKFKFFKILQKRWEILLSQGRRVFVVGDLNIAPSAIDCWDAGPEFEENLFRKWMRSLLQECGGPFIDVFRTMHAHRNEAYTCWSVKNGAEEFNCGSRIDHVLVAGPCLHQNYDKEGHNFLNCHVNECDILTQFKRWKPESESIPSWKGGRSIKLEGSDHAPVYVSLGEMPNLPIHNTPTLAARYIPEVRGRQQNIASLLRRKESAGVIDHGGSCSSHEVKVEEFSKIVNESCYPSDIRFSSANLGAHNIGTNEHLDDLDKVIVNESNAISLSNKRPKPAPRNCVASGKKVRNEDSSQRTLTSFFLKDKRSSIIDVSNSEDSSLSNQVVSSTLKPDPSHATNKTGFPSGTSLDNWEGGSHQNDEVHMNPPMQGQTSFNECCLRENKKGSAVLEWQRIQEIMRRKVPLCHGHSEPCAVRVVKKAGPNLGRGFYVCPRPEGPASNREANCKHFEWASSTSKRKKI